MSNPNNVKPTRYQDFLTNALWPFYFLSMLLALALGGLQCWDEGSAVLTLVSVGIIISALLVGTVLAYNKTWKNSGKSQYHD